MKKSYVKSNALDVDVNYCIIVLYSDFHVYAYSLVTYGYGYGCLGALSVALLVGLLVRRGEYGYGRGSGCSIYSFLY